MASAPVSRAPSIAPSTRTMGTMHAGHDMYESPLLTSMFFSSASLADSSGIPLASVGSDTAALRRALRGSHSSYYLGLPVPSAPGFPPSPGQSSSGSSIRSTSRASTTSRSSMRPRGSMGLMAPVGSAPSSPVGTSQPLPLLMAGGLASTESLPAIPTAHPSEPGPMHHPSGTRARMASLPPGAGAPPSLAALMDVPPVPAVHSRAPVVSSKLSSQSTTAAGPSSSAEAGSSPGGLVPPRPSFMRRVRSAFDLRRRRKSGSTKSE